MRAMTLFFPARTWIALRTARTHRQPSHVLHSQQNGRPVGLQEQQKEQAHERTHSMTRQKLERKQFRAWSTKQQPLLSRG